MRRPGQTDGDADVAGPTAPACSRGTGLASQAAHVQTQEGPGRRTVGGESPAGVGAPAWTFGGRPDASGHRDLVAKLISQGAGRRRLSAQRGISQYSARRNGGAS